MDNKDKVAFAGTYHFEHMRGGALIDSWTDTNLIPTEGLNFVLNVLSQAGTTKISTWYLALATGNYTVAATDTGANIVGRATETALYDEATRVLINWVAATAGVLTNAASKATFTFNSAATITNAYVVSTAPKSDVSGTCLSSLKLGTSKTMAAADQLVVTFVLTASSV